MYVCWKCRDISTTERYGSDRWCRQGHIMQYAYNTHLPRSRDDHKMWKLAEEKYGDKPSRRRRPRRKVVLADWERELLKAAKK